MKIGSCYIRVSTADQVELSPDSQLRMIRDYAKRHDIFLSEEHVYRDEGISGRTAEKRPDFQKMIAAAKRKEFEVILIYSTSRFARNHEQSIVYRSMLEKECGIDVISITQPSIDKKTDMLTNAIYSIMDEWYSMDLADNVRRGMTEKAMRGGYQTYAPLGYERKNKGDDITINEDEAWIIRYIYSEFLGGKSLWAIAQYLNHTGVKPKRGGKFTTRTLYYIVSNPVYIGQTRWTPVKSGHWDFDNPNTIISEGTHDPIVDKEEYEKVQKMLASRKNISVTKTRPPEGTSHWLSGLLKCSSCLGTLNYSSSTAGKFKPRFRCGRYNRGICSTSNSVKADIAEKAVLSYLSEISVDINILFGSNIEVRNVMPAHIDKMKEEVNKLHERLDRAKQGFLNGVFELVEFKAIKEECENRTKKLNKEIAGASKKKNLDVNALQKEINSVCSILTGAYSKNEKQAAIRNVIDKIVFDKKSNEFRIYFFQ